MYLVPEKELNQRIANFQELLSKKRLNGCLIMQNVDLFYFSGTMQDAILFIPVSGSPLLMVRKSFERAQNESKLKNIIGFKIFDEIPSLMQDFGFKNIANLGLEYDVLPVKIYLKFIELFPKTQFFDVSRLIKQVRMIKSDYELKQMRQAAQLSKELFSKLPELLIEGKRELDLAAEVESLYRKAGHQSAIRVRRFSQELLFGPLVSGASMSYPTPFDGPVGAEGLYPAVPQGASTKKISLGEPIMADLVFGYNGYLIDKARTFAIGKLPSELIDTHKFILELNQKIEDLLSPGADCAHIYEKIMDRVQNSPYKEYFMGSGGNQVKFIAHSLGLEIDELPVIAQGFHFELKPGITLAVEPKIFFPDKGGVGIENTYVVKEKGAEKLTVFPENIIYAKA
jgi:Xaa-Pro aminopeptidase